MELDDDDEQRLDMTAMQQEPAKAYSVRHLMAERDWERFTEPWADDFRENLNRALITSRGHGGGRATALYEDITEAAQRDGLPIPPLKMHYDSLNLDE